MAATQVVGARLEAPVSGIGALIECMRPLQWIKNGFVLSALIFSNHLRDPHYALRSILVLAAFCLIASAAYLANDSFDWRANLVHPKECFRPIPSGRLDPLTARLWAVVLLAGGTTIAFGLNTATGLIVITYVTVNLLYSAWLKHQVIVDLMCIALGFVFRVMAGAAAIGVDSSHWILMCTLLLALFLAIAKRRNEILLLANASSGHRKVLEEYRLPWLEQAGTLLAGATIVAYSLYTVAPETVARFGTDHLIYTLPLVIYGILRYLHLEHSGDLTGNPTSTLVSDPWLLGCVGLWSAACVGIIYF